MAPQIEYLSLEIEFAPGTWVDVSAWVRCRRADQRMTRAG